MMHEAGMGRRSLGGAWGTDGLAEQIEGHVARRACGRIRDLHVVCSGGSIILQGRSRTYHAKQLAQQAVLDLFDDHHPSLTNQIEVS